MGEDGGPQRGVRYLAHHGYLEHSGYLAAFGTMVALAKRATQGGSWMVRVSLAQTGRWIDRLGRVDGLGTPDLPPEDVADLMETSETPWGSLLAVAPAAKLSATPGFWARPSVPLGTHPPEWPARAA